MPEGTPTLSSCKRASLTLDKSSHISRNLNSLGFHFSYSLRRRGIRAIIAKPSAIENSPMCTKNSPLSLNSSPAIIAFPLEKAVNETLIVNHMRATADHSLGIAFAKPTIASAYPPFPVGSILSQSVCPMRADWTRAVHQLGDTTASVRRLQIDGPRVPEFLVSIG